MDLRTEIVERLDKHTRIAEVFRRRPAVVQQAMANIRYGLDDPAGDTRRLTNPEARDKALRILDSRDAGDLTDAQKTQVGEAAPPRHGHRPPDPRHENDDYRSAWMKMVNRRPPGPDPGGEPGRPGLVRVPRDGRLDDHRGRVRDPPCSSTRRSS